MWDEIISIEPVYEDETYDLQVEKNDNFTLANKLVVHNSGKTVHALNYIRTFCKEGYTVFDVSLNLDRAGEFLFSLLPVSKKTNPKVYARLTDPKLQDMVPEKIPTIVLIPYYEGVKFPDRIPSCAKIITIPLYMLANKPYAFSLIFKRRLTPDARDIVNTILINEADKSWDLNTLRKRLGQLVKEKKPTLKVTEIIDFPLEDGTTKVIKNVTDVPVDKKTVGMLLRSLVKSSSLISSGYAETTIDFDELTQGGAFVTNYLGHILDKDIAYTYITWLFHAFTDYKRHHLTKKMTPFINEAQEVAPSQSMIGGLDAKMKYGVAVEYAERCLQWRGLGFHALVLSQQRGQLRKQLYTQQGLIIVFHTTNQDDLDYAFGNLANKELAQNMKSLVQSRFFFDEHLCVYVKGTENVDILLGAVPGCELEIQDVDPFKEYVRREKTNIIYTRDQIKLIKQDRLKSLVKSMGPAFLEKAFSGETEKIPAWLNPDERIIRKSVFEKMREVPVDKVLVPKVEAEKMKVVEEDQVIVSKYLKKDIETLEKIPSGLFDTHSKYKYERVNTHLSQIILGSEEQLMFGIDKLWSWMKNLGVDCSRVTVWIATKHWSKHPILSRVLELDASTPCLIWKTNLKIVKMLRQELSQDYLNKIYTICATELSLRIPEISWVDEVLKIRGDFSR